MKAGSDEWRQLITASKVAAILGVSPWESPRSLWLRMHGDIPWDDGNAATRRGQYLEDGILAWWRDQHGVAHSNCAEQPTYTLGDWAAATPDMATFLDPDEPNVLVEAKSTARMDEWGDPGTDVIPPYYLVQVQWQMHVSGVHRCYVPVLGPGLRFAEYLVKYDAKSGPLLEARCRTFYDSLTADEPPELDGSVATYEAIKTLHPDIDPDTTVETDIATGVEYITACTEAKAAETRARAAKTAALDAMGRAKYLAVNGQRIARRQPSRYGVSLIQTTTDPNLIDMEAAS